MSARTGVELAHREAGIVSIRIGGVVDDISKACDGLLGFTSHLEASRFVENGLVGQLVLGRFPRCYLEVGNSTQPILPVIELSSKTVGRESHPCTSSEALYDRGKSLLSAIPVSGKKEGHAEFVAGLLDQLFSRSLGEILSKEGNRHPVCSPFVVEIPTILSITEITIGTVVELRIGPGWGDNSRGLGRAQVDPDELDQGHQEEPDDRFSYEIHVKSGERVSDEGRSITRSCPGSLAEFLEAHPVTLCDLQRLGSVLEL